MNETIDTLQSDGMVWGIEEGDLPLNAGETLTLTPSDSSYVSGTVNSIPTGASVYVHVDSANSSTNYGGVLEVHEILGGDYNNILAMINN